MISAEIFKYKKVKIWFVIEVEVAADPPVKIEKRNENVLKKIEIVKENEKRRGKSFYFVFKIKISILI